MTYEFYWEHTKEGNVRLLRVFAETAEVFIPAEIAGHPVTEIGSYCFAGSARLPEHYQRTCLDISSGEEVSPEVFSVDRNEKNGLWEVAGKLLECLELPESVVKIGSFAFYQCNMLRRLSLGGQVREVGGDAFMNCYRLHRITVQGGIKVAIGIRQILTQISADMEVTFMEGEQTVARLLFPEYLENYDEVAPAHQFTKKIEGEGFRARQCVREGEIDFALYDSIFPRACAEESERTLCTLAMNRLRYPLELKAAGQSRYEEYIRAHAKNVCVDAVRMQQAGTIAFLCEKNLVTANDLDACIRQATEMEWVRGVAELLELKEAHFTPKSVEERYSFDDF